jgi:hypothetical protein
MIMANVKANLSRNYTTGEKGQRNVLYRTSSYFNPSIIDVKLTNQLALANKHYQNQQ